MSYEETGDTKPSKTSIKKAKDKQLQSIDTKSFLWAKAKQHKFFLVTLYAVIITVFYLLPMVPAELFGLING